MRWFGHVCRMQENGSTLRVYEIRLTRKNQKGNPRREWNENFREEVERRGMTREEVKQLNRKEEI